MQSLNPIILGFIFLLVGVTVALLITQRKKAPKQLTSVIPNLTSSAPSSQQEDSSSQTVDAGKSDVVDSASQGLESTAVDLPESPATRKERLKSRFSFGQSGIAAGLRNVFASADSNARWKDLEDALIMADLGVKATGEVIEQLTLAAKNIDFQDAELLNSTARQVLVGIVDGGFDRSLNLERAENHPAVVLTVGVNGTGKTTTTGKLARLLSAQDFDVLLGAADTFRAAAADQLETWGSRVGVPVIRGAEGADPASVAFTAVAQGIEQEVDVVLIDTAGRLHTKTGLMDELGKLYRVASKSGPIAEVLLVIDATTGQNGLLQAKVFAEVVPVTGVVLTKLDGTAKGGIVIAVQQELGVPVKFVGLGEGADDLAPFDPEDFVAGLLD